MRGRYVLPLVASACIRFPGTGTNDTASDPCPGSFISATSAVVTVIDFRIGGIDAAVAFDPDAQINDQPAACVSSNGRAVELVLVLDGFEAGTMIAEVPGAQTYTLGTSAVGTLTLNLADDQLDVPVVVNPAGWDGGQMVVGDVGANILFTIEEASGVSTEGDDVYINMEVDLAVDASSIDTGGIGGGSDDDDTGL